MTNLSTNFAYAGLGIFAVYLLLQLGVELLLRNVRSQLATSDIVSLEPKVWCNKVMYYIRIRGELPGPIARKVLTMKHFFVASNVALVVLVILFVTGNLLK